MKPYPKHDYILDRDLANCERTTPQIVQVWHMKKTLDKLELMLRNLSDDLTEEQLNTVCLAVEMATRAVNNAAYLGSDNVPHLPVEMVLWNN